MPFSIGRERNVARGKVRIFASVPAIYGMIVPLAFMDMTARLYQAICFPLYGIQPVDRRRYTYCSPRGKQLLPRIDRFNCWYCAYANGSAAFVRAVLAETEKYWCPIRHLPKPNIETPAHHKGFAKDGDLKALEKQVTSYPYKK